MSETALDAPTPQAASVGHRARTAIPSVASEIVIAAIARDGSLYPIEKLEAHRRAAFHVAVSIFLFCDGELLIQRRAPGKYHCGGLWANTCCSHPNWGESAESCAARRLREELGVCVPVERHGTVEYSADVGNGLWEHERVELFRGETDRRSLQLAPDPEEVSETRWLSPAALRAEIARRPERFTPWLRIYLERHPDLCL